MSDLPSLLLFFVAAATSHPALQTGPVAAQAVSDAPSLSAEFARLDADGDGTISRLEALKDPEVLRTFRRADRNKDGRLDREEFAISMTLSRSERPREYIKARVAAAP
jgi:EF hand domain-containing protein